MLYKQSSCLGHFPSWKCFFTIPQRSLLSTELVLVYMRVGMSFGIVILFFPITPSWFISFIITAFLFVYRSCLLGSFLWGLFFLLFALLLYFCVYFSLFWHDLGGHVTPHLVEFMCHVWSFSLIPRVEALQLPLCVLSS